MQFRLSTLLLLLVFLGTSLSLFGHILGALVFGGLFLLIAIVAHIIPRMGAILLGILLSIGSVALLLPPLRQPPEVARCYTCKENLKNIGIALHNYHAKYHSFPPAYIADKNGRPMHSWRVLILPYLDNCESIYRRYDFNEPWDGPNNRKLLAARPKAFACPSSITRSQQDASDANYLAIVGSNTVWRGRDSTSLSDLYEHSSNTIMVAETADAIIQWTEPRDFSLDQFENADTRSSTATISSNHSLDQSNLFIAKSVPFAINVCLADGSARRALPARLTIEKLEKGLRIGGAEKFFDDTDSSSDTSTAQTHLRLGNCIAFPIWLLCIVLLLLRALKTRQSLALKQTESRAGECATGKHKSTQPENQE